MMIKKMSVVEYVEHRRKHGNAISAQAITKAIRNGAVVPGLVNYYKYGGTYVLEVDIAELNRHLVVLKKPLKLRGK